MELELRVYEVDPDYRWNFSEWFAEAHPAALGRFISYRDDATFVSMHVAGEPQADGAPTPVRKLTVRRLAPTKGSAISEPAHFARVAESPVLEIRLYRIAPGMRARFGDFLRDRTLGPQLSHGMPVYGQFDSLGDENEFVFLRGFPDLVERDRRKAAFYQSRQWLEELQDEAFSMIEDYSNVLLVAPLR